MARFATVIARFVRAIPYQGRTSCKTLKSLKVSYHEMARTRRIGANIAIPLS